VTSKLEGLLGQPLVVENKGGASTNIGAAFVARSASDGYTVLVGAPNLTANATLYKDLSYNLKTDLAPVTMLAAAPLVLVVNPAVPVNTVDELIAYSKANPKALTYASNGSGSAPFLAAEMFKQMSGASLLHVPYRGSAPAMVAILGNEVQVMFGSLPSTLQHIKAGKLKALAVTSPKRSTMAPDIPTVAELGFPEYQAVTWYGFFVPHGTPAEVIDKLYASTDKVLQMPAVRDNLNRQGFDAVGNTPAQFADYVRTETAQLAKVIEASGATPE